MSQKKNKGRRFATDFGDNEDDIDFGSEDDFDHVQKFSLADLLDRSDQRRAEREQSWRLMMIASILVQTKILVQKSGPCSQPNDNRAFLDCWTPKHSASLSQLLNSQAFIDFSDMYMIDGMIEWYSLCLLQLMDSCVLCGTDSNKV